MTTQEDLQVEPKVPKPWFVRGTGFSEQLSQGDMSIFMRICPDKRYHKGDVIFLAGDPATALHIITDGLVKLSAPTASGNERIFAICGPDDFIGEAFLPDEATYRVDAIAITKTVTCPVSRDQFLRLSNKAPAAVLSFSQILANHLFHCRQQLSDAFDSVKLRAAKVFLDLASRFGKPIGTEGWYELQVELKQDEIASMISATRVAVTMALSELREDGLVQGTRGKYVLNLPALASYIEDDS